MVDPEVRGPGDALSADEETCLAICAQNESLAPIGRWETPLKSLASRGLVVAQDAFNYTITTRGRAVAGGKDDDFIKDWIEASNKIVLARGNALGRSTDEVDDPTIPVPLPPPTMGCVCPPTSEQTCMNPLCPRKPYPTAR